MEERRMGLFRPEEGENLTAYCDTCTTVLYNGPIGTMSEYFIFKRRILEHVVEAEGDHEIFASVPSKEGRVNMADYFAETVNQTELTIYANSIAPEGFFNEASLKPKTKLPKRRAQARRKAIGKEASPKPEEQLPPGKV